MTSEPQITAISLGGGWQSTSMTFMADEGVFGRKPDCAIFADTHWESPALYEHINWMRKQVSFPIYTVDNGRSLKDDLLAGTNMGYASFAAIPAYMKGLDGAKNGMGKRQCTSNYKLIPIYKKLRKLMGLGPRSHISKGSFAEVWIGISIDEAHRMKPARNKWIHNRWPLIEINVSRQDCLVYFKERFPDQPLDKSTCMGCPFQSPRQFVRQYQRFPEEFKTVVAIDEKLRDGLSANATHAPYLHRSMIPVELAVQRDSMQLSFLSDDDQFGNECFGSCGV